MSENDGKGFVSIDDHTLYSVIVGGIVLLLVGYFIVDALKSDSPPKGFPSATTPTNAAALVNQINTSCKWIDYPSWGPETTGPCSQPTPDGLESNDIVFVFTLNGITGTNWVSLIHYSHYKFLCGVAGAENGCETTTAPTEPVYMRLNVVRYKLPLTIKVLITGPTTREFAFKVG